MENKNDKTFSDLFSNSNNENQTHDYTFTDIFNNSNTNENNDLEKQKAEQIVSFDDLFDKLSDGEKNINNNENISNIKIETNKEEIDNFVVETNIENELNKEVITDEQVISADNSDNLNFDNSINQNNDNSLPNQIESENNLFLNNTSDNEVITNDNSSIGSINNNGINFNIFGEQKFDEEDTKLVENKNEDELKNNNDNVSDVIEKNPLFTNNSVFLEENASKEENVSDNSIDVNPFFRETTTNDFEDHKENSFLNSDNSASDFSVKEKENKNENNSPFFENKENSLTDTNKQTYGSTSPFFENEKVAEENPFFQNKINLVENYNPDSTNTTIDTTKSKHYNVKVIKKKEPLFKFILGVLSYALFIWLLLIGVTLLVYVLDIKIRAAKGDYSSPTFNAYVVLTGSMLPEIQVKDVVVTKKVDASKLQEGDVITFSSADSRYLGTIITHRIIKKNPPSETEGYTFQTKGDNNNVADNALVPENNIYGKVILKIPKLGYLQEFLASRGGWIIVILIPCLTVMSYDTVKLVKGIKKKKYKNIKVQK